MPATFILNMHPEVAALHQEGLLERAFHDGLAPNMMFRAEALREEADAQMGTSITMTRRGLLAPITKPRRATDGELQPQRVPYEQWTSTLQRYNGTIDTSLTENAHQIAPVLGSNIHALGVQAAMSMNLIARNGLYLPYLSGHTTLIDGASSGDTTLHVSSLNGFRFVILVGTNVAPQAVSSTYPLPITIGATAIERNVIGAQPDDPADPNGPGTLTLSATVGASVAARGAVLSAYRPAIIRCGGGSSIDAITSTDIITLQDFVNATTRLRVNKVRPHEDGFYHCHIPAEGNGQIFADEVFQRLNTALPDGERYSSAFIGQVAGIRFFINTECPTAANSGDTKETGSNALYSSDIGAETVNESGVPIGRCVITGRGAIYERWFDTKKNYVSEAGMTGVQGDFTIVNNGIPYDTEGIRLVLASPIDRLMDVVRATYDFITDFPAPSDAASGGPEFYKRAVAVEFANA